MCNYHGSANKFGLRHIFYYQITLGKQWSFEKRQLHQANIIVPLGLIACAYHDWNSVHWISWRLALRMAYQSYNITLLIIMCCYNEPRQYQNEWWSTCMLWGVWGVWTVSKQQHIYCENNFVFIKYIFRIKFDLSHSFTGESGERRRPQTLNREWVLFIFLFFPVFQNFWIQKIGNILPCFRMRHGYL